MIKLPFNFKSKDDPNERPSAAFSIYCDAELERLRDADEQFNEPRYKAAMALALARLRAIEKEEGA